jgi:hypothetical protein
MIGGTSCLGCDEIITIYSNSNEFFVCKKGEIMEACD